MEGVRCCVIGPNNYKINSPMNPPVKRTKPIAPLVLFMYTVFVM